MFTDQTDQSAGKNSNWEKENLIPVLVLWINYLGLVGKLSISLGLDFPLLQVPPLWVEGPEPREQCDTSILIYLFCVQFMLLINVIEEKYESFTFSVTSSTHQHFELVQIIKFPRDSIYRSLFLVKNSIISQQRHIEVHSLFIHIIISYMFQEKNWLKI